MSTPFADVNREGDKIVVLACDGMEIVRAEITLHALLNMVEKGARIVRQMAARDPDA